MLHICIDALRWFLVASVTLLDQSWRVHMYMCNKGIIMLLLLDGDDDDDGDNDNTLFTTVT